MDCSSQYLYRLQSEGIINVPHPKGGSFWEYFNWTYTYDFSNHSERDYNKVATKVKFAAFSEKYDRLPIPRINYDTEMSE